MTVVLNNPPTPPSPSNPSILILSETWNVPEWHCIKTCVWLAARLCGAMLGVCVFVWPVVTLQRFAWTHTDRLTHWSYSSSTLLLCVYLCLWASVCMCVRVGIGKVLAQIEQLSIIQCRLVKWVNSQHYTTSFGLTSSFVQSPLSVSSVDVCVCLTFSLLMQIFMLVIEHVCRVFLVLWYVAN